MALPTVRKVVEPHQPVITYRRPGGVATLWEIGASPFSEALTTLLRQPGLTRTRSSSGTGPRTTRSGELINGRG